MPGSTELCTNGTQPGPRNDVRIPFMPELDGVRGLAIALIPIIHLVPSAARYLPSGQWGVRIFFVLSGFLISYILCNLAHDARRARQSTWLSLRQFYLRRIVRIFPVYYIAVFVPLLLGLGVARAIWPWLALFGTNWYMISHNTGVGLLSPLWSVAVEEQFYVVWPLILLTSNKKLWPFLCISMILTGLGFRFWAMSYGLPLRTITVHPLTALDALGLGSLLAVHRSQGTEYDGCSWMNGLVRTLVRVGFCAGLPALILAYGSRVAGAPLPAIDGIASSLFGFSVIALSSQKKAWALTNLLMNPALQWLGRISYSLYAYHGAVGLALVAFVESQGWAWKDSSGLWNLVAIFLSVLAAQLSYTYIESPISSLKRKLPYIAAQGGVR
jgi:peptidoglycan/LPS O-acetylase OafA/YrhL